MEVQLLLHQLGMLLQEGAQKQTQVLDEVLLVIRPSCVGLPDVGVHRQHLGMEVLHVKLP